MLELKEISKEFSSSNAPVKAVDNLTLNIQQGEFFALLGPSGCGKTTLLRMIGGFESPTSGEIHFDGRRVDQLPPHQRQTNMVFQKYALFPHLNVWENVAFGLKMKSVALGEIDARVKEALQLVRMADFEKRGVTTLSGGQQQRIALARALVNRPKILLLDEPLSALDLKLRHQMQDELLRIQRELKITFIFVTHDQDEALSLSDRIAVMNKGKIEQVGTPKEIYDSPRTAFVADFIGDLNTIPNHIVSANEDLPHLVRPEKLQLVPAGAEVSIPSGSFHFRATIEEIIYKGPYTQYIFSSKEDPGLRFSAIASTGVHLSRKQEVDAYWSSTDTYRIE